MTEPNLSLEDTTDLLGITTVEPQRVVGLGSLEFIRPEAFKPIVVEPNRRNYEALLWPPNYSLWTIYRVHESEAKRLCRIRKDELI